MEQTFLTSNPFAVLTLIVAPAMLTNACAVLALSSSNRFLRASERMRAIAQDLQKKDLPEEMRASLLVRVDRGETQGLLLLRAMKHIYIAMGAFTAGTLLSVVGAVAATAHFPNALKIASWIALLVGVVGVLGLILSSIYLFEATRISMMNISDEAKLIRKLSGASPNTPANRPLD